MATRKKSKSIEKPIPDLGVIDDAELCLLLKSTARLGSSDLEVQDVYRLEDRSVVVHTIDDAYDLLEGHLMEEEDELVTSHGDRRGVLAFPDVCLAEVRACSDYESAVKCVGKRGRWLVSPETRRKHAEYLKM
jgi:hypothetical protein